MTIPKFWPKPIPRLFLRYQIFRNRNRDFFPRPNFFETKKRDFFSETKFSETETETFFRDQIFSKPKLGLFFRNQILRNRNPQRFGKSFETEKFWNQNVNLFWELYWELFYGWVWASIGLVLGKSWASLGQVLGKSWASLRQVLGKACSPALHPGEGEMDRITNHFTKIMMWNKAPEMI